ncbi:putative transcription factor [Agrobacterium phage OLIVR2]|uniref:Putative transcription factor n=1 Tax=Agrobacterium phage OLIVR1 TaxID=2723769 RepID=A0A858MRM0_9CAUD|nr:putative transcription factor [Agrobacterium phage OLIVR1]QIW87203.1 putative transcription factor [Agrobacterium phage OLIVR1]QIW87311.1 putative transcription factor [Agrobacterium phage OLIVR2]QIW87418.1 putative transcription factor [Agrobacterium phage OLIVR3]
MIVIRIELHSAVTQKVTELGRMHIANDGSSLDPTIGHYDGKVLRKPDFVRETRTAHVHGHKRQALTIWHLLGKMLKEMGYV